MILLLMLPLINNEELLTEELAKYILNFDEKFKKYEMTPLHVAASEGNIKVLNFYCNWQ